MSLIRVSPTSLSTFDTDDAWGCKRKWWFKYVKGLPDPQGPDAALGDAVHKAIETRQFEGFVPMLQPAQQYIEEVHAGGWELELKLENHELLAEAGAVLAMRIDALNPTKKIIRDWKTKKQLQYAKPGRMLDSDMQMQLYAAAVAEPGEEIEVQHANIASRPPFEFLLTKAISTPETREPIVKKALALSKEMVIYKAISDVNKTEPHRGDARCRNCPFRESCPTGEKTMNLLNMLLNPQASAVSAVTAPATTTAPAAPAQPAPASLGVAPPEVQKFERKLLIHEVSTPVVETPSLPPPPPPTPAVEEPKRGRGRPPGSKNKPKEPQAQASQSTELVTASPAPAPAASSSESSSETSVEGLKLKSITVSRSATVQIVQFEPMSVTVSATADVDGLSLDSAVKALDEQVLGEVVKRLDQLRQAQKDVRGLKP